MDQPRPAWFGELINRLLTRENLDPEQVTVAFRDLVAGRVDDVHASAFLTALRVKGESAAEVAAAARVLREQMVRLVPVSGPVLDTCGTGGDESGTFNISTAASLLVAGAGVPIVKHGNRAVSSRSGSADVLAELGLAIEAGTQWSQRCLDRIGFAFCFAPHFHLGMAHVSKLRRKMGFRTAFNLIGPLANPAEAEFQLLGVSQLALLDTLAGALTRLGVRRAVIVCSADGLDEVSLSAPTHVRVVEGDEYSTLTWQPSEFGLDAVSLRDIQAGSAAESAQIIRNILDNQDGPAMRITLANAAAALWTAGTVSTLKEGVEKARDSVRQGNARSVLEQLIAMRYEG